MGNRLKAAIITDIHHGPRVGNKYGPKALRLVELFVEAVNRKKPDMVVEMGDRISEEDEKTDRKRMMELRRLFNRVAAPVHSIIGNHDIKNLTHQENADIMGSPAESYSVDVNGFHLIFWNPNVDCGEHDDKSPLCGDALTWLKHDLATHDAPTIIFSHIPFDGMFEPGDEDTDTRKIEKRFAYPESLEIRKILEDSDNVILSMAGHLHKNSAKIINGIHYVTLQSLVQAQEGKGKRSPYGTYAFLNVAANDNNDGGTIHIELKGKYRKKYDLSYGSEQVPQP